MMEVEVVKMVKLDVECERKRGVWDESKGFARNWVSSDAIY